MRVVISTYSYILVQSYRYTTPWRWNQSRIKIFVYIWNSLKIGQYRWVVLFLPKQHGNNVVCDCLFVCAHGGICVSQCPFWRSSCVSKIGLYIYILTIPSVFYALNKMSTVSWLCILNACSSYDSSGATVFTLPSNRLLSYKQSVH